MKRGIIFIVAATLTMPLFSMEQDNKQKHNRVLEELLAKTSLRACNQLPDYAEESEATLQIKAAEEMFASLKFTNEDQVLSIKYPIGSFDEQIKKYVIEKMGVAFFTEATFKEVEKFDSAEFTFVMSFFNTLYELNKENIFKNMHRILKDQGHLFVAFYAKQVNDPIIYTFHAIYEEYQDKFSEQGKKIFEFLLEELEKGSCKYYENMVRECGFSSVSVIHYFPKGLILNDIEHLRRFVTSWQVTFLKNLGLGEKEINEAIDKWIEIFLKEIKYTDGPITYPASDFIIQAVK